MYQGREKRKRAERRYKRGVIGLAVFIVFISIYYFLFVSNSRYASNGDFQVVEAGETVKDTISTYGAAAPPARASENLNAQQEPAPTTAAAPEEEAAAIPAPDEKMTVETKAEQKKAAVSEIAEEKPGGPAYQVVAKAHFYSAPDEQTRRKDSIDYWNQTYASIKPIDEKNGFIYVVFKYPSGQVTKGWLRKKDVKKVNPIYENSKE